MTEEIAAWIKDNNVTAIAPDPASVFGIWHARHGDSFGYGNTEQEALIDLYIRAVAAEDRAERKEVV